jgi:hypothetical protein
MDATPFSTSRTGTSRSGLSHSISPGGEEPAPDGVRLVKSVEEIFELSRVLRGASPTMTPQAKGYNPKLAALEQAIARAAAQLADRAVDRYYQPAGDRA